MQPPLSHFAFCPRCGARQPDDRPRDLLRPFRCCHCGFTLFFNAAAAVAALIGRADGSMLFVRRAREPARGRLGMPGGFVDAGETAETALAREVREEVGLEVQDLQYLGSHANQYVYSEVTYTTLDLFFTALAANPDRARPLDGVESLVWGDPLTIDLDEIAFDSMREALREYRRLTAEGQGLRAKG
jgi:ADP-ribose pyrophosphatase YjhB (NUDIX family)